MSCRGLAVLAIFAVNVKMMANGFNHYRDGTLWGSEASLIILLQSRLFDGKFLTIFTALFGAGLALLLDRPRPSPTAIVVRRLFCLALFGVLHLLFLREGDILIWYALCGFLAVPHARLPARSLVVIGLALQAVAFAYYTKFPVSETDAPILWRATPDAYDGVAAILLGSLEGQIVARLEAARYYMLDLFVLGGVWIDTLGTMLLGMALLKTGFLGGGLSVKRYGILAATGLGVASVYYLLRPFLDPEKPTQVLVLSVAGYAHRFGGALFWSALVLAAAGAGWRGARIAAVGRAAFTVYILQSVIGLLLFSNLGFGLFGQLSLSELMVVVLVTWGCFLVAAPYWLRYFRFGPLEWVWRSLTYGARQPLRR